MPLASPRPMVSSLIRTLKPHLILILVIASLETLSLRSQRNSSASPATDARPGAVVALRDDERELAWAGGRSVVGAVGPGVAVVDGGLACDVFSRSAGCEALR